MNTKYYVGDFETTVYAGQEYTEVWASACVELYSDEVTVLHSIDEQFEFFMEQGCNIICYYHNLKFDGSFWLSYLLHDLGFKQAIEQNPDDIFDTHIIDKYKMKNNTFSYNISGMGQWYRILIKVHNCYIELRDSFKLLPFSVRRIGESFGTKHKKLEMEYKGVRYAGCEITQEEMEYIKNDVLVVKEALEIAFNEGHNSLTIGSCCLSEYKKSLPDEYFKNYYPNMVEFDIDPEKFTQENADSWIRKSYKGGWCYVVKGKENKIKEKGVTLDVNSLYPSMMSSESGNRYPIGLPTFWYGNYIPEIAKNERHYFFIRIKTRFKIKKNKLPFIQIKDNLLYNSREMLTTSDVYDKKTKKYYSEYIGLDGEIKQARPELTLTMTDYILFLEQYEVSEFEILGGCYFHAQVGLFDDYIEKYKKIKTTTKGAKRELAKLFLNNLYGKMASNTNSSFKVAYLREDNSVGFYTVPEHKKKPVYIPVGSAITSYARNFTIRAAQANYYGVNKKGFIYADTDSIHCDITADKIKGVKIHDTNFCCWKCEGEWDKGIFVRPKTYIEHITNCDTPYYNIKCAGMPDNCKKLFELSMTQEYTEEDFTNDYVKNFITTKRELTDFKIGLCIYGKLTPHRIKGGIVLQETTYEMR